MLTLCCRKIKTQYKHQEVVISKVKYENLDLGSKFDNNTTKIISKLTTDVPQIVDSHSAISNVTKHELLTFINQMPEIKSKQFSVITTMKDKYKNMQVIIPITNFTNTIIEMIDNMTLVYDAILLCHPLYSNVSFIISIINNELPKQHEVLFSNSLDIIAFANCANNRMKVLYQDTKTVTPYINKYLNSLS